VLKGRGSLGWVVVFTLFIPQGHASQASSPALSVPPIALAPTSSETRALLDSNSFAELDQRFSAIQRDYARRARTDDDLRAAFRVFYATDVALQKKYAAWIAAFPRSYVARLARGIYYVKVGMQRRGGNAISDTTDEQLHGMKVAFARAEEDLRASLALDDKPLLTYAQEMDIATFVGEGDARARAILDAAIKVDRDNIVVREKYMGTLEPRWGGSVEAMQAFLEESKRSGLSSARLGLLEGIILQDKAHTEQEAGDYASSERDYRKAVALGNEDCLVCFAEVLTHSGKFADAIPIYSKFLASHPNSVDTLADRSYAYFQTGMSQQGINDLRAAAEAGSAYAQCELGRYYMVGIPGVLATDPAAGLRWFKKSAAQGFPAGVENLQRAQRVFGDHTAP